MTNKTQIALEEGRILPLMEGFYTLQGEGFYTGTAAYFVRIGGCDVGCHWCDVKESWNEALHPATPIEIIVENAKKVAKTVVITGGEPLQWNMKPLTELLKNQSFKVHIETSGAYLLSGIWDWICLSPKKNKLPLEPIYEVANELKIIVHNKHDLIFAEEQAKKTNQNALLYLQPEWSKQAEITPVLIDYIMQNPQWKLSIQTHKYLNIP